MTEHIVLLCADCASYVDAALRFDIVTASPLNEGWCNGCSAVNTKPMHAFRVSGSLGDPHCGDCLAMTHCETHKKIAGLYPDRSAAAKADPKART